MLVSGKNVIAIDGVKTGNTLKGDGVFNTPGSKLDVNTDVIATKEFVTAEDEKVVEKINAASATLSSKIDSVSSKLTTSAETLSANKQDKLTFGYNNYDEITAINTSALAGGNKVKIESTNSSVGITATTAQDTGLVTYDLSVSSETIINPTDVKAENGLSAATAVNGDKTTFTLGIKSDYLDGVKNDIEELSSNKADKNSVYLKTETSSKTELTTEFAKYQPKGDYYSASNPSAFINKTSGDLYYQPKGNYLSSNALDEIAIASGNWNTTYTNVNTSSKYWNSAYDVAKTVSGLTGLKNFSEIDVYTEGFPTSFSIVPSSNSDKLELSAGKNITIVVNPTDGAIVVTAKDTTYTPGNNIEIIPNEVQDSFKINATGLVTETAFNEYKTSAANELAKKQDKSAMSAYAESAWVVDNFLSANALDDLSGKWEIASNIVSSHSANWDSVYETVKETSGDWNKVSAKLNKSDFEEWSATIDTAFYSAGEGLALDNHTFSISAKYLSANALDDLSGKWEDAADNLSSNSAEWNSVYNTVETYSADWQNVVNSAEKWNTVYDEYTDNSAVWNDTTNTVDSYSAIWNEVSSKANSADLEELSGKVKTLSGELYTASAFIEGQIGYLSGAIDDISDDIDYLSGAIEDKLDTTAFTAWSANADVTPYSAGYGLTLNPDHTFNVSAGMFALSADVDNIKEDIIEQLKDLGYYVCNSEEVDENGVPDETKLGPEGKLSTSKIYLVLDSTAPTPDQYKEWIWYGTVWTCIGDTSMNLSEYLTKAEAERLYQKKLTAGDNIDITNDIISVSGLHNTTLTSTNGSIGITATTDANGDVEYDLSVRTIPSISGINGVSAYYDETDDQYVVGLEDYNDIGFAKYSSSANVYTASAVVDGYTEDLNVNPTKITLDNDKILLKTGFYHVDVQTNFTIANPDDNYYNVLVKSIPNAASITQMIDGSYAHTETVDLSFDVRITNDDTPLEISVENYKTNETFAISNLNIHEIVSMPSQIEGGAGNYQAGPGITIENDTIEAKLGNGLEIDASNAIQVKLGKGLKFDDSQGVQAVTIDSDVNGVVEAVKELQEALDTKITDNFPPAMITLADLQVARNTQYAPNNGGMLIGYLFTCPITHKIYDGSNNDYQTKIGIYTKQWGTGQYDFQFNRVILGIYEYDPDYVNPNNHQVGKTEALCDTGIIELQQGYAEYNIKNLFPNKTRPEMKPGKFYYAAIYMSYGAVDVNGLTLFGAPGYNTQVNNLKPGITITNVNCIRAALYDNMASYDPDLNFDKMGFSWEYNSYPPDPNTQSTSQGIVEAHAAGRPYFAFRNVKIVTGN